MLATTTHCCEIVCPVVLKSLQTLSSGRWEDGGHTVLQKSKLRILGLVNERHNFIESTGKVECVRNNIPLEVRVREF